MSFFLPCFSKERTSAVSLTTYSDRLSTYTPEKHEIDFKHNTDFTNDHMTAAKSLKRPGIHNSQATLNKTRINMLSALLLFDRFGLHYSRRLGCKVALTRSRSLLAASWAPKVRPELCRGVQKDSAEVFSWSEITLSMRTRFWGQFRRGLPTSSAEWKEGTRFTCNLLLFKINLYLLSDLLWALAQVWN